MVVFVRLMAKLGLLDVVIELGTSTTIRRTHPVVAAVVSSIGVDCAVDREILWLLLVSVCSHSLFWLPECNSDLRLMRLYLVTIFG